MSEFAEGLNESQQRVVLHTEGSAQVTAVAGSGKTRAVVNRVARLAAEVTSPDRILCLSFSRAAASEMSARLARMNCEAEVRTFHSLCFEIWRSEQHANTFAVDANGTAYQRVLTAAIGSRGLKVERDVDVGLALFLASRAKQELIYPQRCRYTDERKYVRALERLFARYTHAPALYRKVFLMTEELWSVAGTPKVPQAFRALLANIKRPQLSFDDMLGRAVLMMEQSEDVRKQWAQRFDFVIQDEAQDQNFAQSQLLRLLARDHCNYMMVGDAAQTIYTFAGARPDLFREFPRDDVFGPCAVYTLPENYRCARVVAAVSNEVLARVHLSDKTPVVALAPQRTARGQVECLSAPDSFAVAQQIAADIKARVAADEKLKYRDFAVLCRVNTDAVPVVEALVVEGVPVVSRVTSPYKRAIVNGALAYLRLALGRGTARDVEAVLRRPERYLKARHAATLWKAWTSASTDKYPYTFTHPQGYGAYDSRERSVVRTLEEQLTRFRRAVEDQAERAPEGPSAASVFWSFLEEIDYMRDVASREGEDTVARQTVGLLNVLRPPLEACETLGDLVDWVTWVDQHCRPLQKTKPDVDAVTVCTVHVAKGLEWPHVYLAEFTPDSWPLQYARKPEELAEEDRILYVATTRARDRLVFTYPEERHADVLDDLLDAAAFAEDKEVL